MVTSSYYSDHQGSKSRQKVMRLYKRCRPITKRFIKPPLLHIESSLYRLGLLSPTHNQLSFSATTVFMLLREATGLIMHVQPLLNGFLPTMRDIRARRYYSENSPPFCFCVSSHLLILRSIRADGSSRYPPASRHYAYFLLSIYLSPAHHALRFFIEHSYNSSTNC